MLNGILLLDKPEGFTSFDVIAKLRGITRQKKIGHSGTLDPMATGVLPCLFGGAARLCGLFPCEDKAYRALVRFGVETDTQDLTGTVVAQRGDPLFETALRAALPAFTGEIDQLPPMYSAVSVGGKRLYDLARRGVEVERPARRVTIHALNLVECDETARTALLDVVCSKGTYVRTLAHDLGRTLGTLAALAALRRTAASGFSLADCLTLEEVQRLADEGRLAGRLLPVSDALAALPRLETGSWQAGMLKNGVPLRLDKLDNPPPGRYTVWCGGDFLGLGTVEPEAEGIRLKQF